MKEELIVLKLGGSIVTEKSKTYYTVRNKLLDQIFSIIKTFLTENSNSKLILVHGAGGFVHKLAHDYNLKTGTSGNIKKQKGSNLTHFASRKLNSDVIHIAKKQGVDVTGIDTSSIIKNSSGKLTTMEMSKIEQLLSSDIIPVLNGDMVKDTTLEFSICSGDNIVAHLALVLPVSRILFASDIGGIFTDNPHLNPKATLIEKLTMDEIESDSIKISGSHNIDTTGGLAGKLNSCKNLFKTSESLQTIEIFNGLMPSNFEKALIGKKFNHTIISK